MNDTITIRGIVATAPRHLITGTGLAITSFRLASPSRRWDRATSAWTNGDTNWFTVTAFRTLATNVQESVVKGDRVIVTGRLRVRPWERDDRSGVSVEIDGDGIGHDLAYGRSQWRKVLRHTADETAGPGEHPGDVDRADARSVADAAALGADPATGEVSDGPEDDVPQDDGPGNDGPGNDDLDNADLEDHDRADGRAASLADAAGSGLEARRTAAASAAVTPVPVADAGSFADARSAS